MSKYTKMIENICVLLSVCGMILIYPFVNLLVPKYQSSIIIFRFLLLSVMAGYISYFANVYVVSNKKQWYLVILQVISIISIYVINIIFIKLKLGLLGVALATTLTNLLYSIIEYGIFYKIKLGKYNFIKVLYIFRKFIAFMGLIIVLSIYNISMIYFTIIIIIIISYLVLYFKDLKGILKEVVKV